MSARLATASAVALVVALASPAAVEIAHAQCTYQALTSGLATTTTGGVSYYTFQQTAVFWSALAVRPPAGEDWDMGVYSSSAGYPSCVTGALGGSNLGTGVVDFVVGDFNHDPTGTYYARALRFSGTGNATFEWEDGPDLLTVNAGAVTNATGPSDLIRVWDVPLTASNTYVFSFSHTGNAAVKLFLLRNAGGGVYWGNRSSAVLQISGSGCASYVAPSSGYYAVVAVNDDGGNDSYTVGVSSAPCDCSAPLSSMVPVTDFPNDGRHSFTMNARYWSAVGVRSGSDWDLQLGSNASGTGSPQCIDNLLATSSLAGGVVDFTVGDFNHSALGTYYVRTHQYSGSSNAAVGWYGDARTLDVNLPIQTWNIAASDVVEAWDVYLEAGRTYRFLFLPLQPGLSAFLFRNPGGGAYFAGRNDAETAVGFPTNYTAPSTGYYGLVVANDAGINGSFYLQVGGCTDPVPLTAKNPVFSAGNAFYSFNQFAPTWAAIGLISPTSQRSMKVFDSPTPTAFPDCFTNNLGTVSPLGIDFLVGDFHHNPLATYDLSLADIFIDPTDVANLEWDSSSGAVVPNDNTTTVVSLNATDWMRVYDTHLEAGNEYNLDFNGPLGMAMYIFGNQGNGPYWAAEANKLKQTTGGFATFTPSWTGDYGLVVFDWNGDPLTYNLRLETCPPVTPLASGTSQAVDPEGFGSITQNAPYWTAVGVRSASDWDIEVDQNGTGGTYGVCFTNTLSSSAAGSNVDYVVGDFNSGGNSPGTYYVRPYRYSGAAAGRVEWDGGSDQIIVGDPPVQRSTSSSDVLECWDVFLTGGQTYSIFFNRDAGVDAKIDLFRSSNAPFWAPRSSRVYEATSHGNFTAPASDYYGLVVVNDNGGTGNYRLGVFAGANVAVESGPAVETRLGSIAPNPGRGALRIEYALHEAGPVSFEVLDMAGRSVARLGDGDRPAGTGSVEWSGVGSDGRRMPAGLYFVRMKVADRLVATRKVTLLD